MGLDMSIVFKITSLKDLENLTKALKETATLQGKIQLEGQIKRLNRQRIKLKVEIEALRMEKNGLQPPTEQDKIEVEKEVEAEDALNEGRTTLNEEGATLIEEITEEPIEVIENVEEPELPEAPPDG